MPGLFYFGLVNATCTDFYAVLPVFKRCFEILPVATTKWTWFRADPATDLRSGSWAVFCRFVLRVGDFERILSGMNMSLCNLG
jgi:hypothetical protein